MIREASSRVARAKRKGKRSSWGPPSGRTEIEGHIRAAMAAEGYPQGISRVGRRVIHGSNGFEGRHGERRRGGHGSATASQ